MLITPSLLYLVSHPTRVRGLKLSLSGDERKSFASHPTRVRGLKRELSLSRQTYLFVAPHTGAWIETMLQAAFTQKMQSHPTRVRGLKPKKILDAHLGAGRTPHGCVD